ncbi:YcxB family protein [Pontibacter sp. 172403-2]|uniref:YcxB family protein n=1 Tax=Pontibacter rufus TaxID=2791028 RepID=UPI0018AF802C|nr:YcxB family protein [Pontibacter sp. 172403-2]MBF9251753.1 YcxB family protein [Pontibacter sp. 172403-2]
MQEITIQSKLTLEKYIRLMFRLTYRKFIMLFISFIGVTMLTAGILDFASVWNSIDGPPYFQLIFGTVVVFYLPFTVYRSARKNFLSHANLQENMTYTFTPEQIIIQGETFNSTTSWDKVYKVQELKGWFLIYQSKQVAHLVPKDTFSPEQIFRFREIMAAVPKLKKKAPFRTASA